MQAIFAFSPVGRICCPHFLWRAMSWETDQVTVKTLIESQGLRREGVWSANPGKSSFTTKLKTRKSSQTSRQSKKLRQGSPEVRRLSVAPDRHGTVRGFSCLESNSPNARLTGSHKKPRLMFYCPTGWDRSPYLLIPGVLGERTGIVSNGIIRRACPFPASACHTSEATDGPF
jgi:hypothetical protein